ncbi:MAG: hypothetical protein EB003_10030, partial [Flavobacteriia bacterium]|nr:hypothetical protein [Flavobacteriia bacterium]
MDQAIGRAVRIGQTKQVYVHHISLKEELDMSLNIDHYMMDRAEMKRDLCNKFLEMAAASKQETEEENQDPANDADDDRWSQLSE